MDTKRWHKGQQDHQELARWMYDRACENHWVDPEYADAAWEGTPEVQDWWLDEAWATLVYLGAKCLDLPTEKKVPSNPDGKCLGAEWKVPHLCGDGIHDWKHDDDLSITFCGKCDYWSPDA